MKPQYSPAERLLYTQPHGSPPKYKAVQSISGDGKNKPNKKKKSKKAGKPTTSRKQKKKRPRSK